MATITVEEVNKLYPNAFDADTVQCMIEALNAADECLTANNVAEPTCKLLKLYAVAYQLVEANGGEVVSQRGQSGASRTLANQQGEGLEKNRFGRLLKNLDQYGCVTSLVDNSGTWLFAASIGPDSYE